jgi:hypothetical protein
VQDAGAGRLVARALAASAAGAALGPDAVALLARAYAQAGDERLGDALGMRLAEALRDAADFDGWRPLPSEGRTGWMEERAAWLLLFVDVAPLSEDARIRRAITAGAHAIVAGWPASAPPRAAMREVDAALRAALLLEPGIGGRIVDELERQINRTYHPGSGLTVDDVVAATLDDHVQTAAALVTAYGATSRLPYAMLADDLMQFSRRRWWDGGACANSLQEFAALCGASRVLVRLAAVHADPTYRQGAVVTAGYDHLADAERVLETLESAVEGFGADASVYGLAAQEVGVLLGMKNEE